MSAFLRATHNNRRDPDHQNRTRPRERYGQQRRVRALASSLLLARRSLVRSAQALDLRLEDRIARCQGFVPRGQGLDARGEVVHFFEHRRQLLCQYMYPRTRFSL